MLYRNLENGELCLITDYDEHHNQMLTATCDDPCEVEVNVSLCDFEGEFIDSVVYVFRSWHERDGIWSVLVNGDVALELVDSFMTLLPAYFDGSIKEQTILDPREEAERRAALMDAANNVVPIL